MACLGIGKLEIFLTTRREQILQPDSLVELPADEVPDPVDSLRSVIGRIYMDAEGLSSLGMPNMPRSLQGHLARACVRWGEARQAL